MSEEYIATGGARWGQSFWLARIASWPSATLRASPEGIQIQVDVVGLQVASFKFTRQEIKSIRKRRRFFSVGIIIEHIKGEYPPFIGFGNFNYNALKEGLHQVGYEISET